MTQQETQYKYGSAQEWILMRVDELVRDDKAALLSSFLRPLILKADGDTIQELYQSEMDDDGCFDELKAGDEEACWACGRTFAFENLRHDMRCAECDDDDCDEQTCTHKEIAEHKRCQSCELMRINGVLCHETGCPDAWKDEDRECEWCGAPFTPEEQEQRFCEESCAESFNS